MAVLVTGATGALGRQIALDLAGAGFELVLHGRDRLAVEGVAEAVSEASGRRPEVVGADFAVFREVRGLGSALRDRPLQGLVHCAQTWEPARRETRDRHEWVWQVNHLAPLLLTHLLLKALAAGGGRVVFAGRVLPHTWIRLADLESVEDWTPFDAFARTKLANVLLVVEMARRLDGRAPTLAALDPGFGPRPPPDPVHVPEPAAVRAASEAAVRLVRSEEVRHTSGRYHRGAGEAEMPAIARDPVLGRAVYEAGCAFVRVSPLPFRGLS